MYLFFHKRAGVLLWAAGLPEGRAHLQQFRVSWCLSPGGSYSAKEWGGSHQVLGCQHLSTLTPPRHPCALCALKARSPQVDASSLGHCPQLLGSWETFWLLWFEDGKGWSFLCSFLSTVYGITVPFQALETQTLGFCNPKAFLSAFLLYLSSPEAVNATG